MKMGQVTGISWTDHTFNPWWGCTAVSAGCDHCYAEAFDKRVGGAHWGKGQPRRVFGDKHWAEPLAWDAIAAKAGKPAKVFCASMADVMDDEAPEGQRERLWELIDKTPHLIWQLLTKRPQRYAKYLPLFNCPKNIWLGTSAENQENYNLRWPHLFRAAKARELTTFISYEPALGPLEMRQREARPDWVICGGESGPRRRAMYLGWAEDLKAECEKDGVAFWMKQLSAQTPERGASLIPAHLLIRKFPS
jgi:protein gp37